MTVDLLCDNLGVVVRACGSRVILSAGLKINALVHPTHSPVDLPTKLAVKVFKEVKFAVVTATASELCLGAILVY